MTVLVPGPLRSYTSGKSEVEGRGGTLAELLADLDSTFPGMHFRMVDEQGAIRPHIRLFVNGQLAPSLAERLREGDTVHIICAISGG